MQQHRRALYQTPRPSSGQLSLSVRVARLLTGTSSRHIFSTLVVPANSIKLLKAPKSTSLVLTPQMMVSCAERSQAPSELVVGGTSSNAQRLAASLGRPSELRMRRRPPCACVALGSLGRSLPHYRPSRMEQALLSMSVHGAHTLSTTRLCSTTRAPRHGPS